jgi:cytochrome c oxidase subunit 2
MSDIPMSGLSSLASGIQSALDPQSADAALIAEIAWVLFAGAAVIFSAVMALAGYAVFGRRETTARLSPRLLIVGGGIVFTSVVLLALLVYSLARANALHPHTANALRIEVTGEQWWWRVRYLHADGTTDFVTANEIRLPVGRAVRLDLKSADVIHSFWVPVLAGKLDMIPGRTNRLTLRADRAGEYRGQCAEYCGGPHGLMALVVVAEPPDAFERWVDLQRAPAAATHPLFASYCSACHAVRGTAAAGVLGPDLTHVGSRRTIGAALLPNNHGTLAGWIAGSQHLKPGNHMPDFRHFSGDELRSLAAYLEGLR